MADLQQSDAQGAVLTYRRATTRERIHFERERRIIMSWEWGIDKLDAIPLP